MKKSLLIGGGILIIVAVIIVAILTTHNKQGPITTIPEPAPQKVGVDMCYSYSKVTTSGFTDRAFLRMNILGDQVIGEYKNLPAEKDSKVGTFDGTVGPMDPKISARTADVWWNSMAEGMTATEQLKIVFGEGSAVTQFGEMVDRGDGTYVYKDATKLTNGFQMSQVDCEKLDDQMMVEEYLKKNIATIAPKKAVLGGTWYVTSVDINTTTKTGTVKYEDGHVQEKSSFSYVRNKDTITISWEK